MSRRRPRSRLLAFAVLLPVLAMLLAATAVAAPSKPVFADISPVQSGIFDITADDVAVGTCVEFQFSLTNNTKTQNVGSANVTLDPALAYQADPDLPCPVSKSGPFVGTSADGFTQTGSLNISGLPDAPVAEMRSLSAGPGKTAYFTFSAFVACTTATPVIYDDFSAIAKQANNYSGDPGNNVTIDAASDFSVRAVGICQTFADGTTANGSVSGSGGATFSVQAVSATGGTLILAAGVNGIDCAGYEEHTGTVTVDLTGTSKKILTMSFPKTTNEQKGDYRVCFAADHTWTDRDGGDPVAAGEASLLADCNSNTAPTNLPCMQPVTIQNKTVTIKSWLDGGDPPGRG